MQAYLRIEDEKLWQMATGFGSGMSRRGFVCGAVSGAVMGLGLAVAQQRGSTRDDIRGLREDSYTKIQELTRQFAAKFGSVHCGELTGCDFLTDTGQRDFKDRGLMGGVCRPAVRFAVETAISLI